MGRLINKTELMRKIDRILLSPWLLRFVIVSLVVLLYVGLSGILDVMLYRLILSASPLSIFESPENFNRWLDSKEKYCLLSSVLFQNLIFKQNQGFCNWE